jgi:FkbM family methyltransferase
MTNSTYPVITNHHRQKNLSFLKKLRLKLNKYLNLSLRWIKNNLGPMDRSINYQGYKLLFSKGTSIIEQFDNGIYERKFVQKLQNELVKIQNDNLNFIDVGANIGLISLPVLSKFPQAHIYAFEPGPHQFSYLFKTIKANKLTSRISLSDYALSDHKGSTFFYSHSRQHVSGDGLIDTGRAGESKKIKVKLDTLDHWWKHNKRPNISCLKIDTEGAELYVLQGAREMITATKPIIFFEMQEVNLKVYPYKAVDLIRWLSNQKYDVFTLDDEVVNQKNLEKYLPNHDMYIAKPKKS